MPHQQSCKNSTPLPLPDVKNLLGLHNRTQYRPSLAANSKRRGRDIAPGVCPGSAAPPQFTVYGGVQFRVGRKRGSMPQAVLCANPVKGKGIKSSMSRGSPHSAAVLGTVSGFLLLLLLTVGAVFAQAESCKTADDMDAASRAAIISAGRRYFDMAASGDLSGLRQNAIPSVVSNFSGIEAAVTSHKSEIAGAHGTMRPPFFLDAEGAASIAHAEFLCGVFDKHGQTAGSAVFNLDNLPPGKYAVVILDVASSTRATVSFILQQQGNDWKLGGLYIKPVQAAGHAADWFLSRARDYKTTGQLHNAWLYYRQALSLISPLPFMKTAATDKLIDEFQPLQPADFPADGRTVDLPAGDATYKLTIVFPEAVGNDLDLIVKYQASDVSDTTRTYQSNVTVIKALIAKFPELKAAFSGVVARAVDPGGRDYGTLLAIKDIKKDVK